MAKNKTVADPTAGLFGQFDPVIDKPKEKTNNQKKPIEKINGQESIETLENGNYMPDKKTVKKTNSTSKNQTRKIKINNTKKSKMSVNDDSYLLNLPAELKSDLHIISNMNGYKAFADYLRDVLEGERKNNLDLLDAYKNLMKKRK